MKHVATIYGMDVDAEGNPKADKVVLMHSGQEWTMLFTGKKIVGPFDADELEYLRAALNGKEPAPRMRITGVDLEAKTVTLSADDPNE